MRSDSAAEGENNPKQGNFQVELARIICSPSRPIK
jgi:hypothetical protein